MPITWIPHHQGDDLTALLLDRWAFVNIEMDDQTKLHWADIVDQPREIRITISVEPSALWFKGKDCILTLQLPPAVSQVRTI